jgi:glycosyltransferase involved in cell wall biosynthesis
MTKPSSFNQYLQNYSVAESWKLIAGDTQNISQVIVIPAYDEKNMLFSTLASLAQNSPSSLDYSFVICVINNKKNSPEEVKKNNQQTLEYLQALVSKNSLEQLNLNQTLNDILQLITDSGLKIGYIDASSEGCEIPGNEGGVGMARKIGMDMALNLLAKRSSLKKLILCLDADTLVQSNYLAAIKNYFNNKVKTAIVAYEHQEPANDEERAAIYCYEIFLRYWILGLKYAKSPYAFHSIGSTMVCSADAYLAVRGMNRREAGEDFYFLNKLAKIGDINYIKKTCVYPSARASLRVPFGTGKRIQRFLTHECEEYVLPDPQIFEILAKWLHLMEQPFHYDEKDILINAELIHPLLASFLNNYSFEQVWTRIRRNVKNQDTLINQFHCWFDGFKTLKLINYLSREFYPPINMFVAVDSILKMQQIPLPEFIRAANHLELAEQKMIVQYLREIT